MMEREREKKEGMVRVPMPLMYAPAIIRKRTSWSKSKGRERRGNYVNKFNVECMEQIVHTKSELLFISLYINRA